MYFETIMVHGNGSQVDVAIEEMSELIKELCKHKRGIGNLEHITEELADATIMLEQLRLIFDINDEVEEAMERKLLRQARRNAGEEA
jgi:NTP pyrophosphatase (non-canonical NTP hydrolase)